MIPTSPRFREVITGSHLAVVRARRCVTTQFGPNPVGEDVPILGGDVKMDASADVKATLDVTIPGDYWDETLPLGPELWVARGIDYGGTGLDVELVPLGYYRIERVEQERAPYGPVRIEGKDRTAQLQQNRPAVPWQVPDGTTHRQAFQRIVNGVGGGLPAYPGVVVPIHWDAYNPDAYTVPSGTVVEDDAFGFLAELAADRGATLMFDSYGELRVVTADPDAETATPVYRVAPGRDGVLTRASRAVTREGVYNVVTAYGSDPAYPTGYQTAYNVDPNSPLRWNGPFGASPRFFSSPLLRDAAGAAEAAKTRLQGSTGLPSTLGLYVVPNPAVRPLDVVSALVGTDEAPHVIESLTVPLQIGSDSSPVEIVTRQLNPVGEIVSDPAPMPTPDPVEDPDPTDPGTGGGGTGTETNPANPGEALWIGPTKGKNHYNVGIGTDAHRDTSSTNIAGGFTSANFYISDDFLWVLFKVRADGARTSSNTKYPRSELREFDESDARSAWNGASGTHILRSTWKVTQAGNGSKPWVNVQQIHDADDDVLRIMVKGSSLSALKVVAILRDVETTILSSYTLGQEVTTTIVVTNGDLKVYLGDEKTGTVKLDESDTIKSGNYFKAGCYPNSNTDTEGSSSSQFEAGIKRGTLYTWHTGYADPTTPPWKTAGGSSGGSSGGSTGGGTGSTGDGTQAAVRLDWGPVVDGDEFEYSGAPSSTKWSMYNGEGHDGNGRRVPSAFSVANGTLTCSGLANGDTGGMAFRRNEMYCRVEVRLRTYSVNPSGSGARYHPVLIMWPQSDEWPEGAEYDFFETNCDSGKYGWFMHYPNHEPKTQEGGTQSLDIQNWHNYAFEWSADGLTGYVDGVQAWHYDDNGIQDAPGPMHLTFQLDNFHGDSGMEPAKMEAQWVRIYTRPGA